jgi:hypothetical protein
LCGHDHVGEYVGLHDDFVANNGDDLVHDIARTRLWRTVQRLCVSFVGRKHGQRKWQRGRQNRQSRQSHQRGGKSRDNNDQTRGDSCDDSRDTNAAKRSEKRRWLTA